MAEIRGETFLQVRRVGKLTHRNRRGEVILTDNPRSSASQSPTGMVAGLGSGIRNRAGRLN